jgi:glucose-6-phosphate dehydrogenase assembly protein OpcA
MQIPVGKTLDVEVVEQHLQVLWQETAGEAENDRNTAVLRARVANLLIFISDEELLSDCREILDELTSLHPSRVLTVAGLQDDRDEDIEMSVDSICHTDKRGAKRLSCEAITLIAHGKFAVELPSAALPLLVPDLSTFLWWRGAPDTHEKVFAALAHASDRLILDSVEFAEPHRDLIRTNEVFGNAELDQLGTSDLNWARLTSWRGLLADFYDVAAYRSLLEAISSVQIDYVPPEQSESSIAPQALLFAGWLASRLGWQLSGHQSSGADSRSTKFDFESGSGSHIEVSLNRVERGNRKAGRLAEVKLRSGLDKNASFSVSRTNDNSHLVAEAVLHGATQRGRVLPVRNRSAARLLGREMEILCNDDIYQDAVAVAAEMIGKL